MRRAASVLAFAMLVVVALPSVATAHSVRHDTSIDARRNPGGTVEPGTRVRIFGELSSPSRRCRSDSVVRLIEVGGGRVDSDRTDSSGDFTFRRVAVSETTRFRVVFNGKILDSIHPHNHTCDGSSDGIRVRVG